MKKIGILTFNKSLNYGSALQAFALVKKLRMLGYDAEIIDYKQKNYDFQYKLLKAPITGHAIKYDIIHLAFFKTLIKREKAFSDFCEKYLYLSENKYQYGDNLLVFNELYDCIICGSDQIWNPNAKDFDLNYFLPSIHKPQKISYAVSINGGALSSTSNPELLKSYLLEFDTLSVREKTGKEKLNKFLKGESDISVVIDPTLLHDKEIYDGIVSDRLISKPYIFFYSINFLPDVIQAAENLSKRTGLPVYTLFAGRGNKSLLKIRRKIHVWNKQVGPEDFISLLKYADYVVTNSFHGTAFSIIYEKKFFAIGSCDKAGKIKYDERIRDGLEQFELLNRYITKDEIKDFPLESELDYQKVDKARMDLIQKSIDYLTNALM